MRLFVQNFAAFQLICCVLGALACLCFYVTGELSTPLKAVDAADDDSEKLLKPTSSMDDDEEENGDAYFAGGGGRDVEDALEADIFTEAAVGKSASIAGGAGAVGGGADGDETTTWSRVRTLTGEMLFAEDFLRVVLTNFVHICRWLGIF